MERTSQQDLYGYLFDSMERPLSEEQISHKRLAFKDSIIEMIHNPPGDSLVYRAMGEAIYFDLEDSLFPHLQLARDELITTRTEMDSGLQAALFRLSLQYVIGKKYDLFDPNLALEKSLFWQQLFRRTLSDPLDYALLTECLMLNTNQANIPQRYAGPKMAIAGMLNRPISDLLDSGASAGLGLTQLDHNVPFEPIKFNAPSPANEQLRQLVDQPIEIKGAVGFDINPNNDTDWIENCSLQIKRPVPRIEANRDKRNRLYELGRGRRIILGDITCQKTDLSEVRNQTDDGKFDVTTAVTSLYETDRRRLTIDGKRMSSISRALENLEDMTRDDGLVIVQDFADKYRAGSTLRFHSHIYAHGSHYRLFAKRPGEEWLHLGDWDSGRCREFTPTDAFLGELAVRFS